MRFEVSMRLKAEEKPIVHMVDYKSVQQVSIISCNSVQFKAMKSSDYQYVDTLFIKCGNFPEHANVHVFNIIRILPPNANLLGNRCNTKT